MTMTEEELERRARKLCEQRRRRELKPGSPAARFSQKRLDVALDALAKVKGEG